MKPAEHVMQTRQRTNAAAGNEPISSRRPTTIELWRLL
jgi:hypothetical protein